MKTKYSFTYLGPVIFSVILILIALMATKDLFYDLNYFVHHGETKAKILSIDSKNGTSFSLTVEYFNDFTNRKYVIYDELPDWLIQKNHINEGTLIEIHYSKWKPQKIYFDLQASPSPYIKLGLFLSFIFIGSLTIRSLIKIFQNCKKTRFPSSESLAEDSEADARNIKNR